MYIYIYTCITSHHIARCRGARTQHAAKGIAPEEGLVPMAPTGRALLSLPSLLLLAVVYYH